MAGPEDKCAGRHLLIDAIKSEAVLSHTLEPELFRSFALMARRKVFILTSKVFGQVFVTDNKTAGRNIDVNQVLIVSFNLKQIPEIFRNTKL